MVIGSIGAFFGSLIKAAVSRQREFLADASAVQFTRNPSGIADALKRIGGLSSGSHIESPSAPDASHMFFGQAITAGFSALFATHPPLADRIRRIEPGWDGEFLAPLDSVPDDITPPRRTRPAEPSGRPSLSGAHTRAIGLGGGSLAALVGRPTTAHLAQASKIIAGLEGPLAQAAHDPFSSRAVICAILLSSAPTVRSKQLSSIGAFDPALAAETLRLNARVDVLESSARLALAELASPTLNHMPPSRFSDFRRLMNALVEADGELSIFELSLGRVLAQRLEAHFAKPRRDQLRLLPLSSLGGPITAVLSALAYVGAGDQESAERAFSLAAAGLHDVRGLALAAPGRVTLADLDQAFDALARAAPRAKRAMIDAAAIAIAADRRVTAQEFEILRALTAAMDCPTPPLLPGQLDASR